MLVAIAFTAIQKKGDGPQNVKSNDDENNKKSTNPTLETQLLNASLLPFSKRFPAPARVSHAFHYPALPEVYWKTHKKPSVPLWEPETYQVNEIEE